MTYLFHQVVFNFFGEKKCNYQFAYHHHPPNKRGGVVVNGGRNGMHLIRFTNGYAVFDCRFIFIFMSSSKF